MYMTNNSGYAGYVPVDQLGVSLRAAATAQLMQAVRDRRRERRDDRKRTRALSRQKDGYTTVA